MNDRKSIEELLDSIEASGYSFDLGSRTYQLQYQPEWVELRKQIAELDAKNIARIAKLEAKNEELEWIARALSSSLSELRKNSVAF